MKKKEVFIIVGTRPNFIKVTQFKKMAALFPHIQITIIHTGQHFDAKMADVFFEQFELQPDIFLNISPATANTQMAHIMLALEAEIAKRKPHLMMVVGDVNSTLAAALTANKCGIPIAHLESGLRSFDRTMPEEHNRVLTDALTDYFFVTEQSGIDHLTEERRPASNIFFVGNTMIDTLVAFQQQIEKSDILSLLNVPAQQYILMTMHRPATVDDAEGLKKLATLIADVGKYFKVVFPVHPRTLNHIRNFGLASDFEHNAQLILTEPLDYFAFQHLVKNAKLILTDSGGIQEESTFLQVPCFTLRPNTERPVTVTLGTNELVPFDIPLIMQKLHDVVQNKHKQGQIPPLWDGHATERIMQIIDDILRDDN